MSDRPIRAIIVDDEELARRGIEIRLARILMSKLSGIARTGAKRSKLSRARSPI
jgi:hypothetical protein